MDMAKDPLRELVARLIDGESRPGVLKFHDAYALKISMAFGSGHNHQHWVGGYRDHIVQCLTMAEDLYPVVSRYRDDVGFTLSNAAKVLYFHDVEKIFKYSPPDATAERYHDQLIADTDIWYYGLLPERYQIYFDANEQNALKYVHGEHDHSKTERKMRPLAAFVHSIDVMSARIFHDVKVLKGKTDD